MEGHQIGLIWMTRHKDGEPDVIWHNGMSGGFASFMGFTADRKHGVVILTNAQVSVDDLGLDTLRLAGKAPRESTLNKVHARKGP